MTQTFEDMDAMEKTEQSEDITSEIPICSVCEVVSLKCEPLSSCVHPVCPKCAAMAKLNTSLNSLTCRICAEHEVEKSAATFEPSKQTPVYTDSSSYLADSESSSLRDEINAAASLVKENKVSNTEETQEKKQELVPCKEAQNVSKDEMVLQNEKVHEIMETASVKKNADTEESKSPSKETATLPPMLGQVSSSLGKPEGETLSENVKKIQEALQLATKYSYCQGCFQDKKCQAPDLLCVDCSIRFCNRCSSRHKTMPTNIKHIMLPVEGRLSSDKSNSQGLMCPKHKGTELGMYCRNCETLLCPQCIAQEHHDCPGIVTAQQYASQEREIMKMCRTRYAQVMNFFSEQRRDTEETMAALIMQKRSMQSEVRKFFSTLIKACMDVEGALLEELETAVSDHTDLLTAQSSAWMALQEDMSQLLDITDVLHFLPTADFLPLSMASKTSLSQALRQGEALAADATPKMTLALSLEKSSQRSVVKRIKGIGETALTVATHNTLTLCKVTATSFSAPTDKTEPQVTAMALLSPNTLLVADFNNSCLKLFNREVKGQEWTMVQILQLKWRPYAITQLSKKAQGSPESGGDSFSPSSKSSTESPYKQNSCTESSSSTQRRSFSLERQKAVMMDDKEMASAKIVDIEVEAVVSSPFSGCFIVSVPLSGEKMKITRTITEEKGCWGLAALDEQTLTTSTIDGGHCFIGLLDINHKSKRSLPLTSHFASTSTALVSPRHITATSASSMLVSDLGRKAVLHVNGEGKILFTYTGKHTQQLVRPEGICTDGQGHVYIADSGDHSVSVLTKQGAFYSKTGSQQNDLSCPQTICVDKNGSLYVSNDGGKLLTVYDIIHKG